MQTAIEQFHRNARRVRDLGSLYEALNSQTTQVLDLSDLLRSQLVMIVSALDQYVHELVRLGMWESFRGNRPMTEAFRRFQVTLGGVLDANATQGQGDWLDEQIRTRHSYRSFQHPEQISEAILLVSDVQLWNSVAVHLQSTRQEVTSQLKLIVDRRNKIAHEADLNPSYGQIGVLWPIEFHEVDEAVSFVYRLAESIHAVVV